MIQGWRFPRLTLPWLGFGFWARGGRAGPGASAEPGVRRLEDEGAHEVGEGLEERVRLVARPRRPRVGRRRGDHRVPPVVERLLPQLAEGGPPGACPGGAAGAGFRR